MTQVLPETVIQQMDFSSQGETCGATLYMPSGVERPPVIVMAHGFGGTQEARLPAYARHFCSLGMAALTFDYRHFGRSDGEPRQLLDIQKQLDDWRAAIAFARRLPQVDGSRLAIWGTSFSGGHVLTIAAEDPTLKAVVAQVPFTDGMAHLEPSLHSVRMTVRALIDKGKSLLGLAPASIGVVGPPGSMAAMTSPDAEPGYRRLVADLPVWHNEVAARIALELPLYRPIRQVWRIQAPVLYVIAKHDVVTPVKPAMDAYRRTPRSELVMCDGGHFDPYVMPLYETVVQPQGAFLRKYLLSA